MTLLLRSLRSRLQLATAAAFLSVPVPLIAQTTGEWLAVAKSGRFEQEVGRSYLPGHGFPFERAYSFATVSDGALMAGGDGGIAFYDSSADGWSKADIPVDGPVRQIVASGDRLLAANDSALFLLDSEGRLIRRASLEGKKVNRIATMPDGNGGFLLATSDGLSAADDSLTIRPGSLNELLPDGRKELFWVAAAAGRMAAGGAAGLFEFDGGEWRRLLPAEDAGRSWAPLEVRAVGYEPGGVLWFACPQGVGRRVAEWRLFTGGDGLPYDRFTSLDTASDRSVWFGTEMGAIRWKEGNWAYREGRRWLPDDRVNDILRDRDGTVWFATDGGVGAIRYRPMTFAEKAALYEDEMDRWIKRTEFGYVSEVSLPAPGEKHDVRRHDSDNDGLWTSMYGAGECFAYAVDQSAESKARADAAFRALAFLSEAPVGGSVSEQPGFVARTVLPTTGPDPNLQPGNTLEGMRRSREHDRLWKVYSPRWPKSKDGAWYYKTDTSSDELDGHFFFYGIYHDLVAKTEEERDAVREVVSRIADHLIRNGFRLIDHDGRPTRWGTFDPESLNGTFTWKDERGLNSLSMLSYLKVAEHVTGDARYRAAFDELVTKHHYDVNALIPKMQRGPGTGNQSDDEMAFMSLHNLIRYLEPGEFRTQLLNAFYNYWLLEFPERNPFFNFCYAAVGGGESFRDPWDEWSLAPKDGWLEDSIRTLVEFPLDRVNWRHTNSRRVDVIPLAGPSDHPAEGDRNERRGTLRDGKVIPVAERHFNHWNNDPWRLDSGGDGTVLASGAVYLLPYYMGRYHGFIGTE